LETKIWKDIQSLTSDDLGVVVDVIELSFVELVPLLDFTIATIAKLI
jgi:hypothetical protein